MATLCLTIWGITRLFFIPTSSIWLFQFLYILTKHLFLSVFLIIANLVGMKWCLVVLVCLSLMANGDCILPWLLSYLYMICGEMSTQIPCLFLIALFFIVNFKTSLCILNTSPLSDMWFTDIFSHPVGCIFTFSMVSLKEQKFLIVIKINLSAFCLVACISKNL